MTAAVLPLLEFTPPTIDYVRLLPFLIVIAAACLGVVVEAFVRRTWRHEVQVGLALVALVASGAAIVSGWGSDSLAVVDPIGPDQPVGSVMVDGPTQVFWLMLVLFALLAVCLMAERRVYAGRNAFAPMAAAIPGSQAEAEADQASLEHAEVFPLALFSLSGMMLFVAANDLLLLFVALEVLSLPLYVLAALARHRRLASQEAALKYFLLGAAASAIFLFGCALLFAYAGSFDFDLIALRYDQGAAADRLLWAGLGLVLVGLLFKIGAVPFHSWAPDTYQGAPTPVTAFMAVCTKIAAVAALLRLLFVALGAARWTWQPIIAGVAVVTMLVGPVLGIVQSNIKRLLAYSSIAHAGFLLTGLAGALTVQSGLAADQLGTVASAGFYLMAYGLATIGCFAAVTLVQSQGREVTELSAWAGLGRRHPWFGLVMLVCLLSLAGIPLTAGFTGKLAVFSVAWRGGYWWLVLVAVLAAVVAVYVYVRVLVLLFSRPASDQVEVKLPGPATAVVLTVTVIGSLAFGLVPGPLADLLAQSSTFLRSVHN
ncbi:MAG: NADH-quinone oxidoreductase subunit NuoN [Propionibacteriaceae bacterium]|jgi:NADH-quinone oxidoreductase subunit N|nr:NADH-quinone oxidoreductase subunit NuoN [Propionibacteriaceae bacterium]